MKYRFYLRLKINDDWKEIGINHTIRWEVRDLIHASSGWQIMNQGCIGQASDIVPKLQKGIVELTQSPEKYTTYEVRHGFGTVKQVEKFYADLLDDCNKYPYGEICGTVVDE